MWGLFVVLAVLCVSAQRQTRGIDVSQAVSSASARCLRAQGYEFAIVRAFRSNGAVDSNAASSISNLRAAGFASVGAYMFPCPRCSSESPEQQMSMMLRALSGVRYDRIWLDIEQGSTYWNDISSNRDFLSRLLSAAGSTPLGIYANWNTWREIMGRNFHVAQNLPLWYPHYNSNGQTEADFQTFGGWQGGVARQFSESGRSCGISYDVNWTPDISIFLGNGGSDRGTVSPPPRVTPTPRPTTTPFSPRCVQARVGVNLRSSPNGRIIGSFRAGTQLQASGISNGWYKVPGGYSFANLFTQCSATRPTTSSRMCARVNSNVRSSASMNGKVVRIVPKGVAVTVLGRTGNWLRIQVPSGAIGFSFHNLYTTC